MKRKKLNNTPIIRNDMYHFVKSHIQDDYAMSVLYYELRHTMSTYHFNLAKVNTIEISQRFMEDGDINISHTYSNVKYSLALLLSVRALMVNKKLIQYCHDDYLLYHPLERYDLSDILWYSSLLLDYLDDKDFIKIFRLLTKAYQEESFTAEDYEEFKESTLEPEAHNLRNFYSKIGHKGTITKEVIGECAFLLNDTISEYTINENVKYVGDTAFAFCNSLRILNIKGKDVMFGRFPIIECNNLIHIYVPEDAAEYYKSVLHYYKDIIDVDENQKYNEKNVKQEETKDLDSVSTEENDTQNNESADDEEELTLQDKEVVKEIVKATIEGHNSKEDEKRGKRPRIIDNVGAASPTESTNRIVETNQDFKLHELAKGVVMAKTATDYAVKLENGNEIKIPLKNWKTRLSIVGKKMVLKKEGFDHLNHRTIWMVMTVI